jgi:hypothetical protein
MWSGSGLEIELHYQVWGDWQYMLMKLCWTSRLECLRKSVSGLQVGEWTSLSYMSSWEFCELYGFLVNRRNNKGNTKACRSI